MSFRTDGSANILGFVQTGDKFVLLAAIGDVSVTNPGTSLVARTLTVPSGIKVEVDISVRVVQTDTNETLFGISSADATTGNSLMYNSGEVGGSTGMRASGFLSGVLTNTSSQVKSVVYFSNGNTQLNIYTYGWVDKRGKDG
jgi:hypothetical protein